MGRLSISNWRRLHLVAGMIVALVTLSLYGSAFAQSTPAAPVTLESVNAKADAAALAGHNAWMLTSQPWCCS